MRRRDERKLEVKALREEGYAARMAEKTMQSNPHKYADQHQWRQGWMAADDELRRRDAETPKQS